MCKSQLGMCYSLVKVNEGVKSIVSGCADSLQEEPEMSTCVGRGIEQNMAEVLVNETSVIKEANGVEIKETTVIETVKENGNLQSNTVDSPKTGLSCCTQDMCNYRDSNEITITIDTKTHDENGKLLDSCFFFNPQAVCRTVEIPSYTYKQCTRYILLFEAIIFDF